MKIHADFSKTVSIDINKQQWVKSPMPGVERKPLDRIGDEVARATSIVRYAPGSYFSEHVHTGGEEFIVVDGVFQDEHGDYTAGTYVRNPPQSKHTPRSDNGCVIFVKLWQFTPQDRHQMAIPLFSSVRSTEAPVLSSNITAQSKLVNELYKDEFEHVFTLDFKLGDSFEIYNHKGLELLTLSGQLEIIEDTKQQTLQALSWLRQGVGQSVTMNALSDCKVWVKKDHLRTLEQQIQHLNTVI